MFELALAPNFNINDEVNHLFYSIAISLFAISFFSMGLSQDRLGAYSRCGRFIYSTFWLTISDRKLCDGKYVIKSDENQTI